MGIDILEHCKKVRAEHGPPYTCPIEKCGRTYKSVCGLQYHLKSYDHENPTPQVAPPTTPKSKKKGRSNLGTPSTSKLPAKNPVPEPLTQDEAQKMVQFQLNNQSIRVNINEVLEVCSLEDSPDNDNEEVKPTEYIPLPEASFKELDSYNICDAPPRPNAYIRFIEKSAEELDGEVEYDVDEEDTAWLSIMNEKREEQGLPPVSVDSLELLMDRFEKESYFQAAVNGQTGTVVDDDAVCCICMDGECQNTNVILFCDMCNLAVHQDCYGVPYIPEGQWLCRRCLQSPSRAVDCVLCPNQGGAFKQTDRSQWAHVVCALWIPEVRFANTVFLEPIDSIETIPQARWKLTCYVCKQKGIGACIQCHKTNCYSAFHVTCAQQAGLYMKMDTVTKDGCDTQPLLVQKIAFCDVHAPPDFNDSKKEDVKLKMKQARKLLAKKRSSVPVILIPTIPPERIQEIGSLVTIQKKSQFIQRLIAYWTLKRQFRNGVPLLRRLQSSQDVANVYPGNVRDSGTWNVDTMELIRQLKYWQCLRQDLERARLLCELVRKREKLKVELMKAKHRCLNVELKPLEASLRKVLDLIAAKDVNEIFLEPVDLEEVPDYTTVVTEPMDLSTMTKKLDDGLYPDLKSIEVDFELMISNCLAYNNKDTVFYKAGIKMRDQCATIFKLAREELESAGLLDETTEKKTAVVEEITPAEIDKEFESLQGKTGQETISRLEKLLAKSHELRHGTSRIKRVKLIKGELFKARRACVDNTGSQSDDVEAELNTNSAVKNTSGSPQSHGGSPTGINRRNAVLFTKKAAQAAFKKPGEEKEEVILSPKGKKKGRPRRTQEPTLVEPTNVTISDNVPDSFRVYRPGHQSDDEFDSDTSTSLSTCYSHDLSEIETDEDDDDDNENANSDASSTSAVQGSTSKLSELLKPLQLVWAKCRGYPWYPALIIDPEMPKGYVHNGVPIPSPPNDVLALKANHTEHVYLVLFFDAKRTWQWLPVEKLEILGFETERDEAKVNEPRKTTDRKAVRKAYENALQYQTETCQSMDVDVN